MGLVLMTQDGVEVEADRGYDIYLQRDGGAIPWEDWDEAVRSDPEMELSDAEWICSNSDARRSHAAVWSERGSGPFFWYQRGRVRVSNADAEQRQKAVELANQLEARVVGDDGEDYAGEGPVLRPLVELWKGAPLRASSHSAALCGRLMHWEDSQRDQAVAEAVALSEPEVTELIVAVMSEVGRSNPDDFVDDFPEVVDVLARLSGRAEQRLQAIASLDSALAYPESSLAKLVLQRRRADGS